MFSNRPGHMTSMVDIPKYSKILWPLNMIMLNRVLQNYRNYSIDNLGLTLTFYRKVEYWKMLGHKVLW